MPVANDSCAVTPGSGTSIATQSLSGVEYQVVMPAHPSGQLVGSNPIYCINIPEQVHVNTANTVHWDLFNADASLVVRVLSVRQIPSTTTAVTGVAFAWSLDKTTAVGTGGSTLTPWRPDSSYAALDADITVRSKPTGGATVDYVYWNYSIHSEETNTGNYVAMAMGGRELILPPLNEGNRGLVLRQNQGMRCTQITQSAAGNSGWQIIFSVE
jgi:hypothetical protein